ncbi:MAG: alkaline phosphatase family protein [bacterium]
MKRVIWAAAIVVCGLIVVALVTGTKRVPERHVGLRVGGGGKFTIYDPGTHWVVPFAEAWVLYPVGGIECRFPTTGSFDAITRDGAEAGLALNFRMEIQKESAPEIYKTLGPRFLDTISDALRESVAVEIAEWPKTGGAEKPEAVAATVVEEVTPRLADAGIKLIGYRVDDWDVAFKEDAAPAFAVASKPLRKIVFIGVDGGDWEIIKPLVERGGLPNFRKIIEQGTTGPLESVEPLLSPLVWTTIATGKFPEQHGILNFTVRDPESGKKVPITRMYRKVDAFWNIVGDYGRTIDVVGWLATYPAEAINGVMVTDRVGYLAYAETGEQTGLAPGSVYPQSRADAISHFVG